MKNGMSIKITDEQMTKLRKITGKAQVETGKLYSVSALVKKMIDNEIEYYLENPKEVLKDDTSL